MKILIIDDDTYKVKSIIKVLQTSNINYDLAECRIDALCLLKNNKYDAIILDMQFSNRVNERIEYDMGFKFLEELIIRKIDLPVCIHSSSNDLDFSIYKNVIMYIKYNSSVYLDDQYKEFIKKING